MKHLCNWLNLTAMSSSHKNYNVCFPMQGFSICFCLITNLNRVSLLHKHAELLCSSDAACILKKNNLKFMFLLLPCQPRTKLPSPALKSHALIAYAHNSRTHAGAVGVNQLECVERDASSIPDAERVLILPKAIWHMGEFNKHYFVAGDINRKFPWFVFISTEYIRPQNLTLQRKYL